MLLQYDSIKTHPSSRQKFLLMSALPACVQSLRSRSTCLPSSPSALQLCLGMFLCHVQHHSALGVSQACMSITELAINLHEPVDIGILGGTGEEYVS